MKELKTFLQNQKLLTIATVDTTNEPWIANVYFSMDNKFNLFFVSPPDTKHSGHIKNNSKVAFTTVWYDVNNLGNRKAVQGTGECKLLTGVEQIKLLLSNHYKYFPDWKNIINYENMLNKVIESRPYIIKPNYMKFWNDELYGDEGTKEFRI